MVSHSPRGLATLALLKTRFDQGQDHLSMLEPFIVDGLAHCHQESFLPSDIAELVQQRCRLAVPADSVRTVLNRLSKKGIVRAHGGRFLTTGPVLDPHLDQAREAIESQQRALAGALVAFGLEQNVSIGDEDALAALATFIADNKTPLVLEETLPESPLDRSTMSRKLTRLVARFISTRCMTSDDLRGPVTALLEGMVLQDTLLLRDIADIAQRFGGLIVVLDSPILFAAIGLTGVANGLATNEGLALLREAGAVTIAFDRSITEMRRILAVYEDRVATADGRMSLYPTDLTHHILTSQLPQSEIRTISATLEKRLAAIAIRVREVPRHDARWTLDEAALAAALADIVTHGTDKPRIRHDVDVVAGVLTMRAGRTATALENCRAVLCTTSGRVIRNVQKWHRDQGEHGAPPIVHQYALSSLAWIKKPAAARGVKLHELAAVCAAALRPTRDTWNKFTANLRKLRDDRTLTDDETVAIVASELAEPLLAQLDDDIEPDADTIAEAIERLRNAYRKEAEAAAQQLVLQARSEAALARAAAERAIGRDTRTKQAARDRATAFARRLASVFFYAASVIVLISVVLSLPGIFETVGSTAKIIARVFLAFALGLGAYSQIRGPSLSDLRARLETKLAAGELLSEVVD